MSLTRGKILDRVAEVTGNERTGFRTYLETCLENRLYYIWGYHDWNFKHKTSSVATVAGTETYNLNTGTSDLRSATDIELIYDTTNKRSLTRVDFRDIKSRYPGDTNQGQPSHWAPWGTNKTIYLWPIPAGIYTLAFGYLALPTLPSLDANDMETTCGLPVSLHSCLETLVLADAFIRLDDSRAKDMLVMANDQLMREVAADMKHLDNSARFKFWEEELSPSANTFNHFLRSQFS